MSVLHQLLGAAQAASAIIGSSLARDVVRITDENGNDLFPSARIMRATVREESVFFEHPVEDGTKVADLKITKPVEIQLAVIITGDAYGAAYNALREAYHKSNELIVQTKTGSYARQYLQAMPHEETPQAGDSIAIALALREVEFFKPDIQVLPRTEVAADKKSGGKQDASTVKRGQVKGTETAAVRKESILFELKRNLQYSEYRNELNKYAGRGSAK